MARMRNDADRAAILDKLLQEHIYGKSDDTGDVATTAYPAGDERQDEQMMINRRMPAKVGTPSRKLIDSEDIEDAEGDEDPPDQFAPVMPQKPINLPAPAQGNEMVQVPKPVVDMIMAKMMKSGSRNAVSKADYDE